MSKKGFWIMNVDEADYEYGTCSVCGYNERDAFPRGDTPNYCSNCGTQMVELEKVKVKMSISDLKQAIICCTQNVNCPTCPLSERNDIDGGCVDALLLSLAEYLPEEE